MPKSEITKRTQNHILEFHKKSIQNGVKPVYDRDDRGYLHQFQCYTM